MFQLPMLTTHISLQTIMYNTPLLLALVTRNSTTTQVVSSQQLLVGYETSSKQGVVALCPSTYEAAERVEVEIPVSYVC